jgi:hypothetical protein
VGGRTTVRLLFQSFLPGILMRLKNRMIVKQVLTEAADVPHFFDLSDLQRLKWMIVRAHELGKRSRVCKHVRRAIPEKPSERIAQTNDMAASEVSFFRAVEAIFNHC